MTALDIAKVTELQRRLEMRDSFEKWCRFNLTDNQSPAAHHLLIINTLEALVKNKLNSNSKTP
jgi:hypothetical protein